MVYHFGCGAHFLHSADPGNAETRSRPGDGVRGFMAAQSAWDGDPTGGEIPACMRRVSAAQGPLCRRTSCLRPEGIRDATSVPGSDDGVLYRAGSQLENILPRSHCASRSHGNGAWRLLPRESLLCRHGMCWSFRPLRDNLPDQLPEERECRKPLRGNISQNRKR